jgi:hypothetical protein
VSGLDSHPVLCSFCKELISSATPSATYLITAYTCWLLYCVSLPSDNISAQGCCPEIAIILPESETSKGGQATRGSAHLKAQHLGRLRQEDNELRPAWATQPEKSNNNNKNSNNNNRGQIIYFKCSTNLHFYASISKQV